MIGAVARKLFGSANERRIRSYQPRVGEINALEKELEAFCATNEYRAMWAAEAEADVRTTIDAARLAPIPSK